MAGGDRHGQAAEKDIAGNPLFGPDLFVVPDLDEEAQAVGQIMDVLLDMGAGIEDPARGGVFPAQVPRNGHMGMADEPGIQGDGFQLFPGHKEVFLFLVNGFPGDGAVGQADAEGIVPGDGLLPDPVQVVLSRLGMPGGAEGGIEHHLPVPGLQGTGLKGCQQQDIVPAGHLPPEVLPDSSLPVIIIVVAGQDHHGAAEGAEQVQQLPDGLFGDAGGFVKQIPGDDKKVAFLRVGLFHHGPEGGDPLPGQGFRLDVAGVFQPDMVIPGQKDPEHNVCFPPGGPAGGCPPGASAAVFSVLYRMIQYTTAGAFCQAPGFPGIPRVAKRMAHFHAILEKPGCLPHIVAFFGRAFILFPGQAKDEEDRPGTGQGNGQADASLPEKGKIPHIQQAVAAHHAQAHNDDDPQKQPGDPQNDFQHIHVYLPSGKLVQLLCSASGKP